MPQLDSDRGASHSLQRRLPALVLLLLLAVVATLSFVAYRGLQRALLDAAEAHAARVSAELGRLLAQSPGASQREVAALAAHPGAPALMGPEQGHGEFLATTREVMSRRPQIVGLGVRSSAPGWRLWVPGPAADSIRLSGDDESATAAPRTGPSPIRAAGSALYYDVSAPIAAGNDTTGWLVLRQRIATDESGRVLGDLVGANAVFLLGSNEPGSVWTNLARTVSPAAGLGAGRFEWEGAAYEGAAAPVTGTPWQVWVGLRRAEILAPAQALAGRMAVIGGFILLLGTGGALLLGRHITRPIGRLTHAVETIASGRYHERVPVNRNDEIGRLGAAFNVMAGRVEEGTQNLEAQVEQRTGELANALDELRAAQEQLVRRERLALLGQLASGVGHELRNPLGVMTNAVYYLEMVSPDAPTDVKEYLGILRAQLGLAEKIVADLLDFARVKAPQRDRVSLADLLEEQVARLGDAGRVTVERHYADDAPPASVDAVQIGQVFFNLLTNAMQAIPDAGGRIDLHVGADGPGRVNVSVADSGPGVPPEDLQRIFEPLFTTRARGIGLGLAVSRSLAEANGGEIHIENVPGAGARFTVTLPAA